MEIEINKTIDIDSILSAIAKWKCIGIKENQEDFKADLQDMYDCINALVDHNKQLQEENDNLDEAITNLVKRVGRKDAYIRLLWQRLKHTERKVKIAKYSIPHVKPDNAKDSDSIEELANSFEIFMNKYWDGECFNFKGIRVRLDDKK